VRQEGEVGVMTWLVFIGLSCCEQGEDICVALQTHINDVMLRRYSRTRNVPNGHLANGVDAGGTTNAKPPGIEVYEKHVQEMSKLLEESQRKLDLASSGQSSHSSRFICVPSEWFGSVLTSQSLVSVLRSFWFLACSFQKRSDPKRKGKHKFWKSWQAFGIPSVQRNKHGVRFQKSENDWLSSWATWMLLYRYYIFICMMFIVIMSSLSKYFTLHVAGLIPTS
jgi:hypothetical protein